MGLDVRLCPAAKGSRAARRIDQSDDDAQQDEEEENTRVVGNCGDEAVVDDCVKCGDGGKVCCKQRADDNANKQRAVGLLADEGKHDGDDGRQQRPGRVGQPFAHSMAAATTRTSIAAMTMMRKSTWDLFFMGGSLLHKTKNCVMTAS